MFFHLSSTPLGVSMVSITAQHSAPENTSASATRRDVPRRLVNVGDPHVPVPYCIPKKV